MSAAELAIAPTLALFLLSRSTMLLRPIPIRLPHRHRSGFTLIEVAMTLTLIAILTAMMVPKIGRTLQSVQVNRAAAIVAGDMEAAFTMAGRQRKPMRIAFDGAATYTIADRADGTVRLSRLLTGDSDIGSLTVNFSQTPVDVSPRGVSTAALTVTLSAGASTRAISVSTAGHVRVVQ